MYSHPGVAIVDGMSEFVVAVNKPARFRYQFLEKFEAGIALKGSEVKSLRDKKIQLGDAYATFRGTELYLVNCHIAHYPPAGDFNHEPTRSRKLLLHRAELMKLIGTVKQERLTLVPTRVYFKNGRAKVELSLARGKKHEDRRQELKKKTQQREVELALKKHR